MRKPVVTTCQVGTRILQCSKFWSLQSFTSGLLTMRKLFVNSSARYPGRCVSVRAVSRPSRTATNSLRTTQEQFTTTPSKLRKLVVSMREDLIDLISSLLSSCQEKAAEALCIGRIQIRLGVALVSEFSA